MITDIKTKHITDRDKAAEAMNMITGSLGMAGEFINIEGSQITALNYLDDFSGIDWLVKNKDNQIAGIAVRVQWMKDGKEPYDSFTIRYERHTGTKTEYEKRVEAIKEGYLYPRFTLQAYFNQGNVLLSAAIMKTVDLYDFMKRQPHLVGTNYSDNEFKFVRWCDIEFAEYPIRIFKGMPQKVNNG